MRSIRLYLIPTTVIAICDSSWGNKNALDFLSYKNLIGTYHSPIGVYIDVSFLRTLTVRRYIDSFSEILKLGFISRSNFF